MTRPLNIQPGHIARHTPTNAGAQGREAAIVDIAQDLLLRELAYEGILHALVFKGGTALRKMWAGTAGRFSLDLDFSVAAIDAAPDDVLTDLIAAIDGRVVGPFTYGVTERRSKWTITYQHPYGGQVTLSSKLDLSPATRTGSLGMKDPHLTPSDGYVIAVPAISTPRTSGCCRSPCLRQPNYPRMCVCSTPFSLISIPTNRPSPMPTRPTGHSSYVCSPICLGAV